MKRFLFFTFSGFLLASCASKQIKTTVPSTGLQQGQWETKAVTRDLKTDKSYSLDIDVLADRAGLYRMEVSALMGSQVATLVVNHEHVRYAIYAQKRVFDGRASERSFMPLMHIPLHPANFLAIVFDTPLQGQGWTCSMGEKNLVSECTQAEQGLKVQWLDRTEEGQKKVLISGPAFEMRWLFKPPRTEVQFKDETFRLEPPKEFKIVQLK